MAASAFTAFSAFTEKSSNNQENWQDANTALQDLDKGLRSGKAGEQCDSIVRFPNLFEKFPFPILINAAFLKLAEVFRTGSNFLRLCIFKVAQRSEKHLDKILNVDEFLRRIYSVIHSNDPVARAITIRLLGSIAPIIAERKNAHHSIRTGLHSHDQVELEAAIFATGKFCAQSSEFASGVMNKVALMIEGLTTPVEMKLKLVPIFGHMLHDIQLASKARGVCLKLLESHPSSKFVLVTLHTLSSLAAASVSNITEQVELLLSYLKNDPRKSIKYQCLSDLKMLAEEAPHMWQTKHVEELCNFLLECSYDELKLNGLRILVTLSTTVAVDQFNMDLEVGTGKSRVLSVIKRITGQATQGIFYTAPTGIAASHINVLQICDQECSSPNMVVSAVSCQLLVHIAVAKVKKDDADVGLCSQAALAVEATSIICCSDDQIKPLKVCLSSMNHLISSHPDSCTQLVDSLVALLPTVMESVALEVCHALVTMATQVPSVLVHLRSEIVAFFKEVIATQENSLFLVKEQRETSDTLLVGMATLIFQSYQCFSVDESSEKLQSEVEELFLEETSKIILSSRHWVMYRIARQATRQGFHQLASKIFGSLSSKVASEHFYFWLNALKCFCEAESLLNKPCSTQLLLAENITKACSQYNMGLIELRAAVTPSHELTFQITYAKLRADLLQAHSLLLAACASMKSCPPPAIATAVAMTTGQDVHTLSHFAAQISECSKLFRQLGEHYGRLYQSSFDVDPMSLQNVEILQQSCFLVSYCIDLLTKTTQESYSEVQSSKNTKSISSALSKACTQIYKYVQEYSVQLESVPVCHLQTECLCKTSLSLLHIPYIFPKYFFQSQQHTVIKLALSPTPRSPSEPIFVAMETQFVLKVEGVIEHAGIKPGLYRSINAVRLNVTWKQDERNQNQGPQDLKDPRDSITSLEQTVTPHHDYFSAQFLLSFSTPASYVVMVNTSLIDDTGAHWDTGPRKTLLVKASEAPMNRLRAGSSRN